MVPRLSEDRPDSLGFNEYIRMLPASWLFDHFLKKTNTPRKVLSSSAIAERIKQFTQPGALRRQFEGLDKDNQVTCACVYLLGKTGMSVPENSTGLSDPLVRSFLVYAAKNMEGKVRYFGFSEFEPPLRSLFSERLLDAAAAKGKFSIPSHHQGSLINDFVITAVLAQQGELTKKKPGGLTRHAAARIAKLTHENSLRHERPDCSEVLVAYGLAAGIFSASEESYRLNEGAFEEWLSRSVREQEAELVRFTVSFAGQWRIDLFNELLRTAHFSDPPLHLSAAMFPEKEREAALATLYLFRWAGIIDLAPTSVGPVFGAADRTREEGAAGPHQTIHGGRVVVLPDFSAVIAHDTPLPEIYHFSRIGTLQSLDRVYKGAISRDVLFTSLANGLEGETAVSWLIQWQAPSNVATTVREWIREFYRLYIAEVPLLVVTEEKTAVQVRAFGPLRECLEPLPAHALFRIKSGRLQAVKEILAGMGYDFRMSDRDRPVIDKKDEGGAAGPNDRWEPVVAEEQESVQNSIALYGKKYGAGLKMFDTNEIIHIIDYAILTGSDLVFEYAGSPLIKKGTYTVLPQSISRGAEPLVEAAVKNGAKKQFQIRKIVKIGVAVA